MPIINKNSQSNAAEIKIKIISFAYKSNEPPNANLLFDVRFIENPFWVEHLRLLNGLHSDVQDFVFQQDATNKFLHVFGDMIKVIVPLQAASIATKRGTPSEQESHFIIAFGCTGGWHRSVAIAEKAGQLIKQLFPQQPVQILHREIAAASKESNS